ncbi:helix-turn-helix transcriptional regulator [Thalassolituus sp. LLYu03]|uniref:helix-turn-helix transcriptional regulator n=1 Tax=Thalassolituus sp. LLYu03 TaxID=3421656 RepID=UPI003D2DD85E
MDALHCSADALHSLLRLLAAKGLKTRQLPRFELPADALFNSRARIPLSALLDLLNWARQTLNQPDLALDFGMTLALTPQDQEFSLVRFSNGQLEKPAALAAFDLLLHGSGEDELTLELAWNPLSGISSGLRPVATELALSWLHQRWLPVLAGRHDQLSIELHAPMTVGCMAPWLPEKVVVSGHTRLVFPRHWAELPAESHRMPDIRCDAAAPSLLITHKAANIFRAELNEAPPLDELAKRLGLSERTCKRRLQECGTHYQKLLGELRLIQASYWLQQYQHNVTEVAVLLGYSSVANFSKAFKKWCGYSPSQVRHGVPAMRNSTGPIRLALPETQL